MLFPPAKPLPVGHSTAAPKLVLDPATEYPRPPSTWLEEDFNWKTRSPKGDYKRVLELLAIQLVRGWSLSYRFLIGNLPRRHVHMGRRVDDDMEDGSGHAAGARNKG